MNGLARKDENLKYWIRRYQYAIGTLRKENPIAQRSHILDYASRIVQLKKELYQLTGKCAPESPKWPL